ncbi:MAG TPA: hypothetical protein VK785_00815 [Opitutaceae bacterium]|jgi:hypothetical protein|nr:hypothetical protein [Opitutaceae bacterium]
MPTVYLFRIDGSKDNDAFFDALSPSAAHVYAGIDFRVGTVEWIPDFVKVDVDDSGSRCSLTLIELEATESEALRSCRKFLPENSTAIVGALVNYLGRVIRQCQQTADRRANDFRRLRALLSEMKHVKVSTAGALRSSTQFVEDMLLIDQPKFDATPRPIQNEDRGSDARKFLGKMRLGAGDAKAVARCVMILDAIVRGRDHSVAIFRTWRAQNRSQPLKYLLIHNPKLYPALRSFLFEKGNSGLMLDFEAILAELTELWSLTRKQAIDSERIRSLITSYYPAANKVTSHEVMTGIFDIARRHLSESFPDFIQDATVRGS